MKNFRYILYFIAVAVLAGCTDDDLPVYPDREDSKGIGEIVQFAAGRTNSNLSTRADGDGDNYSETPGRTYYMPQDYRFVCRMYYKAQATSEDFDITDNSKSVAWLIVDDKGAGNSLYWNNQYNMSVVNTSIKGEGGVDDYGNDYAADFFYWQNRREHAFLAWTDMNKATQLVGPKNSNDTGSGKLQMDGDMIYAEHTGIKDIQHVFSAYTISGDDTKFKNIDEDFVDHVKSNYSTIQANATQISDLASIPSVYDYDPAKIDMYYRPLNNVRYSTYYGRQFGEKYSPEDENELVSYYYGPTLLWIWGEGQEAIYDFNPENGDVVDTENPEANGDCWVYNNNVKVALRKKVYVGAGTTGALHEVVPDPTPEDPEHKITKYYIYKYLATWPSGKFHYDFTQQPMYTIAFNRFYEVKETEIINNYNVNKFDLTRGTKSSINEQPDILQALKIQKPEYAQQTLNRVNLYFKHQFSQVQVNLKPASDNSVSLSVNDIKKVELLGVSEEGYVFTELNADGTVHPAAYKDVVISDYSEDELKENEFGTSFSMFDMATGKDAEGNDLGTTGAGPDAGYALGYLKSYNGITFGQLKAIRITWEEPDTHIEHQATMKVTDQRLSSLRSGFKYIWNIELRRGTLATLRVDIVDWIVPNNELKYETQGTIDE